MGPDALLLGPFALKINISINHVPDEGTISNLRLDGFEGPTIRALATNGQPVDLNGSNLVLVHHFQERRVVNLFIFGTNIEVLEHRQQYRCDNQPK